MKGSFLFTLGTLNRSVARWYAVPVVTSMLWVAAVGVVRGADPYDKTLEARVEALERELNIMEGDSKGKDVNATDVPTFMRAAGTCGSVTTTRTRTFSIRERETSSRPAAICTGCV